MNMRTKGKNKKWGVVSAALSALAIALCPTICKFAYRFEWTSISLSFAALLIASISLFIYNKAKKISMKLEKTEWIPVLIASVLNFAGTICCNEASSLIPAGSTTALRYLYPAIIIISSTIFFSFKPKAVKIISAVLNIVGVFCFFEIGGNMLLGCIIGVANAFFYASYSLVVEHTVLENTDPFKLTFYIVAISTVLAAILGLCTGKMIFPKEGESYIWALALGIVVNVLGVVFFQSAVQNIGAAQASLTATLEPLTSIILGALIFSEGITWKTGIGCVLIIVGILLNSISTIKDTSSSVDQKKSDCDT